MAGAVYHAGCAVVGTPGVLGEALRTGGAGGVDQCEADINLVAGAMVAESLYGVDAHVAGRRRAFASLTTGTKSNTQTGFAG